MKAQCCPICHGRTTMPASFYNQTGDPVECKSCKGDGYVLVPGYESAPIYPQPMPYPVPYPTPQWPPIRPWVTWGSGTIKVEPTTKYEVIS